MSYSVKCLKTDISKIIELRADELRKGKPVDCARFLEDNLPNTLHFGGVVDDELACCLTLIECPEAEIPTWQLRGMATKKTWQRKGLGRNLLHFAELHLRNRYPKICIWCNARSSAVPFYTYMGYRIISEPFDIPQIGLHYKMEKKLL